MLGIAGEVVYDVSGLTIPSSDQDGNLEAYDAAQLFTRSARRTRSDFSLQKRDYAALFELCKTLNGMPLALELAASWVRLFSLEDLVRELRRDVDLLATTGRQVTERHRSLRAVFEQSWRFLSPEEQRVMAALAVFHGGFDRRAASTVTGASAKTLLSLVNKSLLRSAASGRFSILIVIRQYAAEKLAESTAEVQRQHGLYYLGFLADAREALQGSAPKSVLTGLEQDLENLRAAWRWACGVRRFDLCASVLSSLRTFFTARVHLQEGVAFLNQALSGLDESEARFSASVKLELAYFFRRLDRQHEASRYAREALQLAQSLAGAERLTTECLCELTISGCWLGTFEESAHYAEQALTLSQNLQDPDLIVTCKSRLAQAKRYLGAFDDAQRLYQAVLSHERSAGRQLDMLRTLSDLGRLYVDTNKPHKARALFSEGLSLAESQDMPFELGFMWEGLSQCSYLLGDYPQALRQAETALACSEAVQDLIGIAVQCAELAKIQLALGHAVQAEAYLKRALETAWEKKELPEVMKMLVVWAELFSHRQLPEKAVELLVHVLEHSGSEFVSKQEALRLLGHLDSVARERPEAPLADVITDLLN